MNFPSDKQRLQAEEIAWDYLPLTNGEVWTILDALADGDDPIDALSEYRFYRSPAGRKQESQDAWDSGRY